MHAVPSTGGNVAVSHGRNGAGSIANASGGGQEAGAGSGASQPHPQGTPGVTRVESESGIALWYLLLTQALSLPSPSFSLLCLLVC